MRPDFSIDVPRNGSYFQGWEMLGLVEVDGERTYPPLDLTGHVISLNVRAAAGAVSVLGSGVIDIYDPLNGRFNVRIDGDQFDAFGSPFETARLAYDLKHTYPDGLSRIYVRGQILLTPEVTF